MQGHPDTEIFAWAQEHQRTIITADLDFAHILNFPPPHFGIMVLRLPETIPTRDLTREVLNALAQLAGQSLANTLFIVEPGRVRNRSDASRSEATVVCRALKKEPDMEEEDSAEGSVAALC